MQAPRPLLVVVDPDPVEFPRLAEALTRRYSADYDVISFSGATEALAQLDEAGREVALLIAPEPAGGMSALEFFERARSS